jgi:type II secretory pathway pseudopilin PulG
MSWGLVAVAGATVVSGAMSSRSASKQADAASDASAAQLAFEQERYDDWKAVYGPIQDNLSNYYSNVTPEYYAAVGLETFEQQYQTSLQRMDENFAQRGIDPSSGIAASLETQAELGAAETRAAIRRDAPRQAAEDKSRFLQIGLGQNPASSVSGALSQQAQVAQQNSLAAQQAAGQAWSAAIPSVGRAIDAYNTRPVTSGGTQMAGQPYIDYNTPTV